MAQELLKLASSPPRDAQERGELCAAARSLYMSLESPQDAASRLLASSYQLPMVQIGVDLGLFRVLSESDSAHSLEELAIATHADPVLLYRILRYLVPFGLLQENADGKYLATDITRHFSTPGAEGGVKHYKQTITPVLQALPEVLKKQKYQNPTDPLDTAFQIAHNTKLHGYSWIPSDKSAITAFQTFLAAQRAQSWTDSFPVESLKLSDADEQNGRPFFVDVGGATGSQSVNLRQSFPDLKGAIILQDQESVVARIDKEDLASKGVETQAYDFFHEQPVKGSRAYYMRNIMHDWPDEQCVKILQNTKAAMRSDSWILLDEIVLPDRGASWKQAQMDIQMMAGLAAMERSVSQWHALLEKAGLKVQRIHTYNEDNGMSVIVGVLA